MPCARWAIRVVGWLVVLLLISPAWAEDDAGPIQLLVPGDPAPIAGVLFPESSAKRLVEELRDARAAQAELETLKAALDAKEQQLNALQAAITELKDEAHKRELAMAIAEDREKRRQADEDRLLKALERAEKTIDRAEKRIETLERRQFWTTILGPIGLALALIAGTFVH